MIRHDTDAISSVVSQTQQWLYAATVSTLANARSPGKRGTNGAPVARPRCATSTPRWHATATPTATPAVRCAATKRAGHCKSSDWEQQLRHADLLNNTAAATTTQTTHPTALHLQHAPSTWFRIDQHPAGAAVWSRAVQRLPRAKMPPSDNHSRHCRVPSQPVEFRGMSLQESVRELIHSRLPKIGSGGGGERDLGERLRRDRHGFQHRRNRFAPPETPRGIAKSRSNAECRGRDAAASPRNPIIRSHPAFTDERVMPQAIRIHQTGGPEVLQYEDGRGRRAGA